jgi:hypothetical protein
VDGSKGKKKKEEGKKVKGKEIKTALYRPDLRV